MPGIEDRLAKINAIKAEAEAKKTAEAEKTAKESAEKRTGLEQEKAQVEGELAQTTEELQKTESGLAEINAMDLSALDAESRAAIESELVGVKEEIDNLSGKVAELTKRKQEIDEALKGATGETEKGLDEGVAESKEEKADNSPELTTKEDPELTKLGKDAGMIDAIHGFKFVLEQNLSQTIMKAVKNPQAVDIKALDFAITAGTERITQLKQSPESVLQDLKNWAEFGDSRLTSKTKQKIKDLKKLPQESLDTIVKIFQARVDDARLLKQKEEEKNHA